MGIDWTSQRACVQPNHREPHKPRQALLAGLADAMDSDGSKRQGNPSASLLARVP